MFGILGCVVGSDEVEEVENRMLAAHSGAVVASVDYRMAPEYKFPYAVNDCFDALKWVTKPCCHMSSQVHLCISVQV